MGQLAEVWILVQGAGKLYSMNTTKCTAEKCKASACCRGVCMKHLTPQNASNTDLFKSLKQAPGPPTVAGDYAFGNNDRGKYSKIGSAIWNATMKDHGHVLFPEADIYRIYTKLIYNGYDNGFMELPTTLYGDLGKFLEWSKDKRFKAEARDVIKWFSLVKKKIDKPTKKSVEDYWEDFLDEGYQKFIQGDHPGLALVMDEVIKDAAQRLMLVL